MHGIKQRLTAGAAALALAVTGTMTALGDGVLKGDVNGDGSVNMKDVSALQRKLNGWEIEINETNADLDGSGKLNMKDLSSLQRLVNGWKDDTDDPKPVDDSSQDDSSETDDSEEEESKAEPKIIGYKYKTIHHDEVTKDAVMNVKMQLDGIKLACDYNNTLPDSSHYNGNDEFLSIVQLQYNDWETFRSKVVFSTSTKSVKNATATDLKNAYLNGEIEFYCDFPGLNTSKSAFDWFIDRYIPGFHKNYPNNKTTDAELESGIKNDWKKDGYSSWQEYAFHKWNIGVSTHWITGRFDVGVWHKPYKKLVTFEYATIQRVGVIYDNDTTANITPVDTDYTSEKAFLKKQGLTLNENDPEWVKYNSYEYHKPTSIDDLPY